MTALSDALAAAQAKALSALEKSYVRGVIDTEALVEGMNAIGCTDTVDQVLLVESLNTLKEHGTSEPTYTERRQTEAPTEAQKVYIAKLAYDRGCVSPDLAGVSRAEASQIIEELKAGTYDPDKHSLPF